MKNSTEKNVEENEKLGKALWRKYKTFTQVHKFVYFLGCARNVNRCYFFSLF